jgi:tetratricopeptide (TPR) repeat protein
MKPGLRPLCIGVVIAALFTVTIHGQGIEDKLQQADSLYQKYKQSEDIAAIKEAVAALDEIQQANPDVYAVLWRRSRAYYGLGDDTEQNSEKLKLFNQAIQSARQAIAVNPGGVEGHYWLGVTLGGYGEAQGMFKAVSLVGSIRKEIETVIRLDPSYESAGGYLVLGRMDFELPPILGGSKKRSIREYEQGLKIAPSNPIIKIYLAESYIDADRRPEAKALLEDVLSAAGSGAEYNDAKRHAQELIGGLGSAGARSANVLQSTSPPPCDIFITDDTTKNTLCFVSATGSYEFIRCSDSFTVTGTGTVTEVNSIIHLTDFSNTRRVSGGFNEGSLNGSAVIYFLTAPGGAWESFQVNQTKPAAPPCPAALPTPTPTPSGTPTPTPTPAHLGYAPEDWANLGDWTSVYVFIALALVWFGWRAARSWKT